MPYEPFYERFRELALRETRSFTLADNHPSLPDDEYALLELYCNDVNCDCRRVFFNVVSRKRQAIMAVVTYGWESEAFYRKWYGGGNDELASLVVDEMAGLGLNSASPQSPIARALLAPIREVLQDPDYVARLKRHYQIFKETVDPKHFGKTSAAKRVDSVHSTPAKNMRDYRATLVKPKPKKRRRN